jgi:hypothetical protein
VWRECILWEQIWLGYGCLPCLNTVQVKTSCYNVTAEIFAKDILSKDILSKDILSEDILSKIFSQKSVNNR